MKLSIRTLYLYLFSFLGLLITVVGTIRLVNVGIKTFIFPEADTYVYVSAPPRFDAEGKQIQESEEEKKAREENDRLNIIRQRQRELTEAFSFILVGIPLYVYHWRTIQKDYEQERRHNG
ncbi:MAG: hypothetical protein N3A54_04690 [Patescibacteria group bacterium]|nr:hypothetical protein [Patescibacteria group bacterium]